MTWQCTMAWAYQKRVPYPPRFARSKIVYRKGWKASVSGNGKHVNLSTLENMHKEILVWFMKRCGKNKIRMPSIRGPNLWLESPPPLSSFHASSFQAAQLPVLRENDSLRVNQSTIYTRDVNDMTMHHSLDLSKACAISTTFCSVENCLSLMLKSQGCWEW